MYNPLEIVDPPHLYPTDHDIGTENRIKLVLTGHGPRVAPKESFERTQKQQPARHK